jgi:hypothetical protein
VAIPSATQLAQRIGQNPDIARWLVEVAQRRAANQEETKKIPDLTAGGGFRRFSDTRDNALSFHLSIPVFDRSPGECLKHGIGSPRLGRSVGLWKCGCERTSPPRMPSYPPLLQRPHSCKTKWCLAPVVPLRLSAKAIGRENMASWTS